MLAGARGWWRRRSPTVRAGVGGGALATLAAAALLAVQTDPSHWAGVLARVSLARSAPWLLPAVGVCLPCVGAFLLPGFLGGGFAAHRYRALAATDPGPPAAVALIAFVVLLPVTVALGLGFLAWLAVAVAILVDSGLLAALLFGAFFGALLFGLALGGAVVFAVLGALSAPAGLLAVRAWSGQRERGR